MEEDVRFELTDPFESSVFKTDAIGHSANLPYLVGAEGIEPSQEHLSSAKRLIRPLWIPSHAPNIFTFSF